MASRLRNASGTKISFFAFQDIITSVTGILILVTLVLTLYLNNAAAPAAESSGDQNSTENKLARALDQVSKLNSQNAARQQDQTAAAGSPDTNRLQADIKNLQSQLASQLARSDKLKSELQQQDAAEREKEKVFGLVDLRDQVRQAQSAISALTNAIQMAKAENQPATEAARQAQAALQKAMEKSRQLWLIPESDASGKEPILVTVSGAKLIFERFNNSASRLEISAAAADTDFTAQMQRWDTHKEYLVFYVRPSGIALFRRCRDSAKTAGFDVGFDAVKEDQQILFQSPPTP